VIICVGVLFWSFVCFSQLRGGHLQYILGSLVCVMCTWNSINAYAVFVLCLQFPRFVLRLFYAAKGSQSPSSKREH